MKERVKELATDVGISVEYLTNTKQWTLIEALAELIVKECVQRIEGCAVEFDDNHPNDQFIAGYNKGVSKTASQVKQHFGVEE